MQADDQARYLEYRAHIEGNVLGPALRHAVLIFILLQTFVFIPADFLLYREHFESFLVARLALNAALGVVWAFTAVRWPGPSSIAVCAFGTALFLSMVQETGGVTSGYYVGLILLVVGMGFLTPQNTRQAAFISLMMFGGYAALPLYTRDPVGWLTFSENLFFLGAACAEACWACLHMERMRFADFKQQRQLEEARDELAELDRAKSRFSANVHHELRTPLTLILAPLDALRGGELGELSPSVQRTLATMQANGRRLHKMINNLLDLSKVESDQFGIVRRPTRLGPIVEELVTGARALADRKGVVLEATGFETLPEINADADALDKVFVNLVGNALKFTDPGGRIEIRGVATDDGIEVAVADTGIGIPPEKLDAIFDRFAQVDASATRRYEGTGIGLSLAKEMVERHGGRIWAESLGLGMGTTMHFRMPIGEPDVDVDDQLLEDDQGSAMGTRQSIAAIEADLQMGTDPGHEPELVEMERSVERWSDRADVADRVVAASQHADDVPEILIAEDNPDMRALLALLIGKEFRVRVARNGREALDSLRERAPDLILSDVMMPEMSGIELCRAVKGDSRTRAVPVVLVTSKAEREMKIEGLELGADDYVTKPFHPRELLARVRSLVRVSSLQKQLALRNESLERALRELKLAEVQLVQSERLAAVGELAAGIAHEVNNPVNFALNAARAMEATVEDLKYVVEELAAESGRPPVAVAELDRRSATKSAVAPEGIAELSDTLTELAGIIAEGLSRTSTLVGNLRDFAAPGRSGERSATVRVEKGLRSTVQLLKHSLDRHGARIDLEIAEDLPTIVGDAGGLNQVFLNLIKNAAEAFGEEGGTIHVSLARDHDRLVVVVADDGPGIPPEHRSVLFEPFFTTKEVGEGTGLGLSISRQIVVAHGGSLEVWSELGRGSRFTVRLPIADPADPALLPAAADPTHR